MSNSKCNKQNCPGNDYEICRRFRLVTSMWPPQTRNERVALLQLSEDRNTLAVSSRTSKVFDKMKTLSVSWKHIKVWLKWALAWIVTLVIIAFAHEIIPH